MCGTDSCCVERAAREQGAGEHGKISGHIPCKIVLFRQVLRVAGRGAEHKAIGRWLGGAHRSTGEHRSEAKSSLE